MSVKKTIPARRSSARRNPVRTLFLALIGTLICVPAPVHAQRDNDPLVALVADGKGHVNYHAGVVKATGYGAPPAASNVSSPAQARLMAIGAAKADALRNLAMAVSSVQVTAETTVKNYVLENDTVKTQISALLKSPRVISEKFQPDGTAVVVVALPLYGEDSIAAVVFPEALPEFKRRIARVNLPDPEPGAEALPRGGAGADADGRFRGPEKPAVRVAAPRPAAKPAPLRGPEPGPTPLSDPGPFSAVIIDCRGLGVKAIMSPKLYDTAGREVYGTVRVTPEYAIETGIVSYPRSMAEAIQSARAGNHPLIVKAIRVGDKHRFNPVISLEDADRILAANNRDGFLEQTRVIFLVDPIRY
ncbi:MAG: hypothetical protein OHK0029_01300 [Armatimonadaceae bacterium]